MAPSMPNYLVVDSSILIFYVRKGKLENFCRRKEANYKVIIPSDSAGLFAGCLGCWLETFKFVVNNTVYSG